MLEPNVLPDRSFQACNTPTASFPQCASQCALLAEASHRVANEFALLSSYIHLSLREFQREPGTVQTLQLVLASVAAKAAALASLNRMLVPRGVPAGPVDVSRVLHEVCTTFQGQIGSGHRVVDAVTQAYPVAPAASLVVAQIVTEAVMNALKYAYPEGQTGDITVQAASRDAGEVVIEVVDRGVGAAPGVHSAAGGGFGIRLMRMLASQEDIGLSFVPASPGLAVRLAVPLALPLVAPLAAPMGDAAGSGTR
jgi:two-component sensor histidine kinase